MNKIYGYARISTKHQSIERQVRNIKEYCSEAVIIEEVYTGTKIEGRDKFNKLLKIVEEGDTIIFDSVSRMSRNSEEGYTLYEELYSKGINLVFLKEHYIDTDIFRDEEAKQIDMVGDDVDIILEAVNKYMLQVAKKQIKLAFDQAQLEVDTLRQRTKEGLITAKLEGKQIGRAVGDKVETKKAKEAKKRILKDCKTFGGAIKDIDLIKILGITKKTYYTYKKQLKEEYGDVVQ